MKQSIELFPNKQEYKCYANAADNESNKREAKKKTAKNTKKKI